MAMAKPMSAEVTVVAAGIYLAATLGSVPAADACARFQRGSFKSDFIFPRNCITEFRRDALIELRLRVRARAFGRNALNSP